MAVVVSAILLLGSTGSALAKFPYFSVALDPAEPRPDQPITVTVRTWADAAHSEPAGFAYEVPDEELITDLIEFQRVGDGEGLRRLPVALDIVKVDLFIGEVRLPAGEWRLVAFPHGRGALGDFGPGYPDPIHIVVEEEPGAAWLVLSLAAGAVALLLALWSVRTRTSRARVARPSTSAP
jgi:hypothetical protein